jgi:hypothetical protein
MTRERVYAKKPLFIYRKFLRIFYKIVIHKLNILQYFTIIKYLIFLNSYSIIKNLIKIRKRKRKVYLKRKKIYEIIIKKYKKKNKYLTFLLYF